MDIRISTRNTEVTDRFRQTVLGKVNRAVRVFGDLGAVDVEIIRETNPRLTDERFRIEMTAKVMGRIIRVEAAAPEATMALDTAGDRFVRRVRRLKEKVIQSHRQSGSTSPDTTEPGGDEIVRVKRFAMKPMNLAEAQLQMEMLGHSFFFFMNASNNRHSVLYRRRDGRLGLIESG